MFRELVFKANVTQNTHRVEQVHLTTDTKYKTCGLKTVLELNH